MKDLQEIRDILSRHKKELKRKYKLRKIGIFGSYVRGEQREDSDVDILVDFDELPDLLKFVNLEHYLEELLQLKVDLVRRQALRKELKERVLGEVVMA